ncbi:MAG: hypothetical protein FWD85_01545 [Microbacteriaceae bacterium]|nr:hypothetical protein [Microbacteriaceae bacterium]MCL2793971.1 hypothetical protein [Microbacteriaceae bacterium]
MSSPVTDEQMLANLGLAREYAIVLLRKNPDAPIAGDEARAIVWEHGRRNFELRDAGLLDIVLPIRDESDLAGIGVFNTTGDEASALMAADPGVQAGLFTFEVHACRGFPGDALGANDRAGTPPTR